MFEERKKFFIAIESNISSALLSLSEPEKLKTILYDLDIFLQDRWPAIFSSMNDYPLNENEKKTLQTFLTQIENLNKKVGYKLSFFEDFQKYMKESIEKKRY
tara:strand:- start:257 stop:562 length:306 start_codon:yes stop_codon:yes gene_type:complete